MLALELRKAFLFPEESGVGVVKITESHLKSLGVHALQPRILFFPLDKLVDEVVAGEGAAC